MLNTSLTFFVSVRKVKAGRFALVVEIAPGLSPSHIEPLLFVNLRGWKYDRIAVNYRIARQTFYPASNRKSL